MLIRIIHIRIYKYKYIFYVIPYKQNERWIFNYKHS